MTKCKFNANKYDYIVHLFTSDDELRPAMQKVHLENGFLYASNAHYLIRLKKDLCKKEYKPVEDYPNAEAIFQQHQQAEIINTNANNLLDEFSMMNLIFHYEKEGCSDCEGDGDVECPCCYNITTCKSCDGTGKTSKIKPFSKMTLSGQYINMFGKWYTPNLLNTVIMAFIIANETDITVSNGKPTGGSLFSSKNIDIVLMPKLHPE